MGAAVAAILMAAAMPAGPAAGGDGRIGLSCKGMESVRIGQGPPRTIPFAIALAMDLAARTYCYADCGADQTYPIADATAVPVRLADSMAGGQMRSLTFDRTTGILRDRQSFASGLGTIRREAVARCIAAPLRPPAGAPQMQPAKP